MDQINILFDPFHIQVYVNMDIKFSMQLIYIFTFVSTKQEQIRTKIYSLSEQDKYKKYKQEKYPYTIGTLFHSYLVSCNSHSLQWVRSINISHSHFQMVISLTLVDCTLKQLTINYST